MGTEDRTKCRHRQRIKTIRFSAAERRYLEVRAKRTGVSVNEQIRKLVQADMKRAGVPLT